MRRTGADRSGPAAVFRERGARHGVPGPPARRLLIGRRRARTDTASYQVALVPSPAGLGQLSVPAAIVFDSAPEGRSIDTVDEVEPGHNLITLW